MTNRDVPGANIENPFDALRSIGTELAKRVTNAGLAALVILVIVLAVIMIVGLLIDRMVVFYSVLPIIAVALIPVALIAVRTSQNRKTLRAPSSPTASLTSLGRQGATHTSDLVEYLTTTESSDVKALLGQIALDVAEVLRLPVEHVRSNIFARLPNGKLGIIPSFTHNMGDPPEELRLEIPVGSGSTGRCFAFIRPNIATFDAGWEENVLNRPGMAKIHPQLRWIISTPITSGNPPQCIWVLNVDGIVDSKAKEELQPIMSELVNVGQMLSVVVAHAIQRSNSQKGGANAVREGSEKA